MSVNYAAEKFGEHLSLAYQTFELSEQIPYSNCPLQKKKKHCVTFAFAKLFFCP